MYGNLYLSLHCVPSFVKDKFKVINLNHIISTLKITLLSTKPSGGTPRSTGSPSLSKSTENSVVSPMLENLPEVRLFHFFRYWPSNAPAFIKLVQNRPNAHRLNFAPGCSVDSINENIPFHSVDWTNGGLAGYAKDYPENERIEHADSAINIGN